MMRTIDQIVEEKKKMNDLEKMENSKRYFPGVPQSETGQTAIILSDQPAAHEISHLKKFRTREKG